MELQHHGIKGQKWGIRRFQNKDGSLTRKGRLRYQDNDVDKSSLKQTTRNGETIEFLKKPDSLMSRFLSKYSKRISENLDKSLMYDIRDSNGKKSVI